MKTERFEADNEKQVARFIPSREDSYERLVEEDCLQFADEEMSVEDAVEYREMIRYLYQALAQLEVAEQALMKSTSCCGSRSCRSAKIWWKRQ